MKIEKSEKYPNLYRRERSPYWWFRRYCSEKRKEFFRSTGVEKDEAQAYRVGSDMFTKWLGMRIDHSIGRELIVRDIARAILAGKETKRDATYRSSKNQIENHVLPAFGHLKPSQVTSLKWDLYDAEERKKGKRTKLFNTRKALIEILNRAKEEGLIQQVPKLKNHDDESRQGKYLDDLTVQRILNVASPQTRLLLEIIYRMGTRPGEVIQWEWDMIDWEKGDHGSIYIPGRITKTGRSREIPINSRVSELLKPLHGETESKFLFPSPIDSRKPIREYKTGWKSACRRAFGKKVDYIVYDLRHTWVTNQAKRGINPVFTAKYSDTSIQMIQKIYAKAEPRAMQEAAG